MKRNRTMKKFLSFVFVIFLFSIGYAQLAVPTLYSPSNNSTNMAVTQRLCVTKISGASYYEIELDTTSNFDSPLKQTLNADTYYSYSSYYYTTVSNLLYGTKYYWRARCANTTDTSGWSAVWYFTTRAVPQLYSPNNSTTNMPLVCPACYLLRNLIRLFNRIRHSGSGILFRAERARAFARGR